MSDDTSNTTIKVGKWNSFPAGGHSSGFSMTNDTSYASIEYFVDVPYDAYYHLYVYIVTTQLIRQEQDILFIIKMIHRYFMLIR